MTWLRQMLDWQRETGRPERVPGRAAVRPAAPPRSSSSPRRATSSRCRPARRRSTSRTPCTPRSGTAASAPGSTAGWCRWSRALDNGDVVEIFTSKSETAGPSRDWLTLRQESRGPAPRSASGSPRSGARTRSRPARTRSPRRCASRACRCSGCSAGDALMTLARDLHHADVAGALRGGRREPGVGPVRGAEAGAGARRRRRARPRTSPRPPSPTRPRAAAVQRPTRASWSRASSDVWVKLARCCTPVPGDPIFGFVTRGAACRCTATTASTPRT